MDSKNRMDGCVCANGAKVAEIVHPYCPAHVPPEMEAELASLRAEVARLKGTVNDLNHRAIHARADLEDAREELERLKSRPVGVPWEVFDQLCACVSYAETYAPSYAVPTAINARMWLASLPDASPMADYDGRELEDRPPPWQVDTEEVDV